MNNDFLSNKVSIKSCLGAAMVELAILLSLFLVPFVFGSIELGRALMQQNQISQRVDVITRYLSRAEDFVSIDDGCTFPGGSDVVTRAEDIFFYGEPIDSGDLSAFFSHLEESDFSLVISSSPIVATGPSPGTVTPGCTIRVEVSGIPFNSIFGGSSIVPMFDIAPFTFSASSEIRYVRDF